jgi:hypothetical protein
MPSEDPYGTTATPRWVKVSAVVTLVVLLLFAIVLITGRGGEHGPGRHDGPPAGVPEHR